MGVYGLFCNGEGGNFSIEPDLKFLLFYPPKCYKLFESAKGGAVMDASFWISLIGTLITTIGFLITVVQIRRTATIAKAAENAASNLKIKLSAYDFLSDCAKAAKSLEHANRFLKLKLWSDAADVLSDAQILLNRISTSDRVSEKGKSASTSMSEALIGVIGDLEDCAEKGVDFDYREVRISMIKLRGILDGESISQSREVEA